MAVIAAAAVTAWRVVELKALVIKRADQAVHAIGVRGFALHHWLHDWQAGGQFAALGEGQGRILTPQERTALANHAATDILGAAYPGPNIDVDYLIGQPNGEKRAFGIVVVRNNGTARGVWQAMERGLARHEGSAAAEQLAALVSGFAFDQDRDIAVFAWPFGAIDTKRVLRQARSGWAPLPMEVDLKMAGQMAGQMAGNPLVNIARLEAATITTGTVYANQGNDIVLAGPTGMAPRDVNQPTLQTLDLSISGAVEVGGDFNTSGQPTGLTAQDVQLMMDMDVAGGVTTGSLFSNTVQGVALHNNGQLATRQMRASQLTVNGGCTGC